eukprot:7084445-Pyramimonas_sp.AAC.1
MLTSPCPPPPLTPRALAPVRFLGPRSWRWFSDPMASDVPGLRAELKLPGLGHCDAKFGIAP